MTQQTDSVSRAGMIPKRILVGFDGSPFAEQAFEMALSLAALAGARLGVVSVATLPEPPGEVETQATLESAAEHYEAAYENLRRRAEDRGLTLETRILVGHPAEQIIRLAASTQVDLIVVGHRGRSRISEWISGSVSKRVVGHAPCSVLVVRSR
ncbi:MAG: universal stress protein [Acidobacteria bacterium]|nr:universal stress protein [Acidobacteriota bacterium]